MELPAADAVAAVKGVVDVFDGELQERAVLWARLSFCSAGWGKVAGCMCGFFIELCVRLLGLHSVAFFIIGGVRFHIAFLRIRSWASWVGPLRPAAGYIYTQHVQRACTIFHFSLLNCSRYRYPVSALPLSFRYSRPHPHVCLRRPFRGTTAWRPLRLWHFTQQSAHQTPHQNQSYAS